MNFVNKKIASDPNWFPGHLTRMRMGVPDEAHNHERDAVGSRFNEVGARYRKENLSE
jgi:hypothetical protein